MLVREWAIGRAAATVEEIAAETEAVAGVPGEVADVGAGVAGVPEAVGAEAGTGVLGAAAEVEADTKLCHVSHAESTRGRDESCGPCVLDNLCLTILTIRTWHNFPPTRPGRNRRFVKVGLSNIEGTLNERGSRYF